MKRKAYAVIALLVMFLLTWGWSEAEGGSSDIQSQTRTIRESYDTTDFEDPISSVAHWGEGYISLFSRTSFGGSQPSFSLPHWVDTLTSNDFNGDGLADLIVTGSRYCNVLGYVENDGKNKELNMSQIDLWIDGAEGGQPGPTAGVGGEPIDPEGFCGLTSGDYDGDGDNDFLFLCAHTIGFNGIKRAWLYRNRLVETGYVNFTRIDMTGDWAHDLKGIAWSSTMLSSLDFDGDGDVDILMGNSEGEVLLLRNLDAGYVHEESFWLESQPLIETGWGGCGISALAVFDGDGDDFPDILVGSVGTSSLRYYLNDGFENFSLQQTFSDPDGDTLDDDFDGAAAACLCHDFDRDGDVDFVVGTDNWNYHTDETDDFGGRAYYFDNQDGQFVSSLILSPHGQVDPKNKKTTGYSVDVDTAGKVDIDSDGFMDFFLADHIRASENEGSESETVRGHIFYRAVEPAFNLQGIAQSTVLTPGLAGQNLITGARIRTLTQGVDGAKTEGLSLVFYLSNDGGRTWAFYTEYRNDAIVSVCDLPELKFTTFGSQLCYKILFYAARDGRSAGSKETPVIYDLELEYTYVGDAEFSRSAPVYASFVNSEGENRQLLIAGSFLYPSLEGHLRAYDVTRMAVTDPDYAVRTLSTSNLTTVTGRNILVEGMTLVWDAGHWLKYRSPGSRRIYTALPSSATGNLLRMDFSQVNAALLQNYLKEPDHDEEGLIAFVRGEGRSWKLGWIDHSTPVVVGPPEGMDALFGPGYAEFKARWADRDERVYVGSNDGMLHCFDLRTGDERWAYVPHNLLARLKDLSLSDPETGERIFNTACEVFVDASPVVKDVFFDPDGDGRGEWITLLICGQGKGRGDGVDAGQYFYFALDITDPDNPQPLWEFSPFGIGETWASPEIGRILHDGTDKWAVFTGSGYGADPIDFYILNASTGRILHSYDVAGVTSQPGLGVTIPNALPGSPGVIDIDRDGLLDRVYWGDLNGRLWRIDLTAQVFGAEIIYEDRANAPILTKPAVWLNRVLGETAPHVYFGTGGDDRAPEAREYSFVALRDSVNPYVEWYIGNSAQMNLDLHADDRGDLQHGEKVWADPVVDGGIIYFSTFKGNIEEVDPLYDQGEPGRLYARYIDASRGLPGTSIFMGANGYLPLVCKTRAAVTLGGYRSVGGDEWKREVFIQEFDSTLEGLILGDGISDLPGNGLGGGGPRMKIKSWREVIELIRE